MNQRDKTVGRGRTAVKLFTSWEMRTLEAGTEVRAGEWLKVPCISKAENFRDPLSIRMRKKQELRVLETMPQMAD